jgi:outer membrane protein, heavy metal efflux system
VKPIFTPWHEILAMFACLQLSWRRLKCWPAILALGLLTGCVRFQSQPLSPEKTAASLESRSLDNPALKSFLTTNLNRELKPWPAANWDFEMLTLAAFYYHPSLEVARAAWQGASAGVVTAGQRPNPTVSYMPQYVFNSHGEPPWVHTLTLDIPIETAGKRAARLAQARHLSDSARLTLAATAWQVRSQLRVCVIDYVSAMRREALLRQEVSLEEQVVKSLEQRRDAGALASSEIMPTRLLLQKALLDLAGAEQQQAEAHARMAEAIGVPLGALKDVQIEYDLTSLPPGLDRLTSRDVRRQALLHRADVLAALADYGASESAVQIEVARQYPDIHINTGYEFDQGLQKWGFLGFGVELPIFNRNEGRLAQAEARRKEAAARVEAVQAKVIAELDRALAVYESVGKSLESSQAFLAAQRQQQASAEQQVQAGAADRLDVLTVKVDMAASELTLADTQTKLHQALGALEDAVQRPRTGWPDLERAPTAQAKSSGKKIQ